MTPRRSKSIETSFSRGALLFLLLISAACGGGGSTALAPQVVKTDPGNEEGNVPVTASIRATFSYAVDPATVNKETFIVNGGEGTVQGTVRYLDQTAVFTPSPETPLGEGKRYYVVLTTGIKDLDGIPLPSTFNWSFETAGLPSVESVDPAKDGAPVDAPVTVVFSKSIDPATVNAQTFFMKKEGDPAPIGAAIASDGARKATLDPTAPLAFSTKYTVTVTTGVKDRAGNPLSAEKTWSFITAVAPDTTPPTITIKAPASNATGVSTNTSVSVTFDEKVDRDSLQSGFSLQGPNGTIPTTLQYDSSVSLTATLQPGSDLDFATTYQVVLRSGVADISGNHLPADVVWSFTTGKAPDHIPPTVIRESRIPADGAEKTPVRSKIVARFSEPIDANSVMTQNGFAVYRIPQGTREPVPGDVTLDKDLLVATFTPSPRLKYGSTYSVILSGRIKDLSGNLLDQTDAFWTFRTVDPFRADTLSPANLEQNVPTTTSITVHFSRTINPASVTPDSFKIEGGPGGAFTFPDDKTAVLTLNAPLEAGSRYQVILTEAIEDDTGNPLQGNPNDEPIDGPYVWSFTTASPVETPPGVVSTDPAHGTTGLSVHLPQISALFDKPIDPATLPGRFTLIDSNGIGVFGSFDQSSGSQAVLSYPSNSALLYNTWYRATLEAGIRSASHGSSTGQPYFWCFRTEPDPTMAPPPETAPPEWCARPGA